MPDMTAKHLTSPALTALRSATQAQHAELDQRSPLTSTALDDQAYLAHAARVLGWMRPLERAVWHGPLAHSLPAELSPAARSVKSRWLEQDLAEAGLSGEEIAALPDCPYIPVPQSLPEAFGMTYVIEGATLGGSYLLRELSPRMPNLSLTWLRGYGQQTGTLWKEFLRLLDRHVLSEPDIAAAATSAQQTFRSFRLWVIDEANSMPR